MESQSSVPYEFALLQRCLGTITDPRHARGKVHPLLGVLSLTVLALMAGARSLSGVMRFGQLRPEVHAPLGLRRGPSVATLSRLLRAVSVAQVRSALIEFSRQLHAHRQGADGLGVVAADGKTLRGVWENGKQAHVLHLFAHRSALALDQAAVAEHTVEAAATQRWLEEVAQQFPGLAILTGDAGLAERDLCAAIVAGQRDYVLRLKKTS